MWNNSTRIAPTQWREIIKFQLIVNVLNGQCNDKVSFFLSKIAKNVSKKVVCEICSFFLHQKEARQLRMMRVVAKNIDFYFLSSKILRYKGESDYWYYYYWFSYLQDKLLFSQKSIRSRRQHLLNLKLKFNLENFFHSYFPNLFQPVIFNLLLAQTVFERVRLFLEKGNMFIALY